MSDPERDPTPAGGFCEDEACSDMRTSFQDVASRSRLALPETDKKTLRFSFKRAGIVTKRVFREITRDKRTFGMIIMMPLITMAVFGLALGGNIRNLPVLLDNEDPGYTGMVAPGHFITLDEGSIMSTSLMNNSQLSVTNGTYASGKADVDAGTYFAVVLIPANFSQDIFDKLIKGQDVNISVQIYLDATNPQIKAAILSAIEIALQAALQGNAKTGAISIDQQYAFGGVNPSGLDTSMPAVMGFVLTMLVLIISSITLMRESTGGTEERLFSTPLHSSERLVGYAGALTLLSLILVTAMLVISGLLFGVTIQGSLFLLIVMFILYALSNILMAVFMSNFAKNEMQAVQMGVMIALPSMALSGVLIPVVAFPAWVQIICHFIPMYYAVTIFQGIMLRGWGLVQLWPDVLIICVFAIIFIVLAIVTVKDKVKA
jgi:ABC-2 type transport system permease protein